MGLMFVEYLMERRSRLEDILKQSGWGNSPPNPTDGKLMLYLYSINVVGCNYIQCNFTSQHNCDVEYVNNVHFYVDFVASN